MQKFDTLLVGGTGFIGEHLLREFSDSRTAVFHSGKNVYVSTPNVFYFCDDNGEFFFDEIVNQVSRIIFLAQPNIAFLKRVVSVIGEGGPKVLLYASSLMIYKGGKDSQKETDELSPITLYAKQKLEEERILEEFSKKNKKIKIIIARLGNVYGDVKNRGIIGLAFNSLFHAKKEIVISGDGTSVRDFIFVDDAAKIFFLLLKKAKDGLNIVNVSTGEGYTILEVIKKIEKITGKDICYHYGPIQEEVVSVVGDTQKLESLIGTFKKTTVDDGLRIAYKRYVIKNEYNA
ncbi:MAG: NAD-dependent epimerase/dehydratase family protein [Candidatus Pacebacteria bacterium]|jgi:nucleoside-diphosphate-sugar epimerase|nr:NAD-dependent epimerase/dehydratase family protein [Candidatus Paceibacterota bacterium]